MAFLRSVAATESGPSLQGESVTLRIPSPGDYLEWAELRAESREFLVPWEPAWARDELTKSAYRRRLRQYQSDLRKETGYAFFIFRSFDGALVGGINMNNVRRGVTQAASLGYWMGRPFAGRGHMSDAVRTILPYAFLTLWLHRLEAACLPRNVASIRVLESNGFLQEGLARRYLRINGVWQDHLLYAVLADDPRGPSGRAGPSRSERA